ncbi:MAG: DUF2846 domain-containing protein [Rhodospirillales bacterium]
MRFAVVLTMMLSLVGCGTVTVPMAPPEDDARAKSFAVAPGKSNIYVYRVADRASRLMVFMDGQLVGDTVPATYLMWEVSPGPHVVRSTGAFFPAVTVNAVAGRNHFVRQHVTIGIILGTPVSFEEVDEETGRREIAGCKRAKSNL